jgi:hypothetical protein
MTLVPLTEKRGIAAAFRQMAERLQADTQAFDRKIGYHGGYVEHAIHWHNRHRFWCLFDPTYVETRYWCCYGTAEPKDETMLSIAVETNSPYEGVNRRIGGVFVRDDEGRAYIAHSGKVGGGRPGIGKEAFWEFYGGEQVETVQWPDGQKSRMIVIGRIDSEHLPVHVARFVHEVARFKAAATSKKTVLRRQRLRRIFTPEFEGPRRGYEPSGEVEARCDHGIVVNRLHEALTEAGHNAVNDRRDLYILDGDKVTHLFEVKTDLSTTSVYQGVGQLMLHGAALDPVPKRIFVVPGAPDRTTRQALDRLGISVLVFDWEDGQPIFRRLREVLS